MQFAIDKFSQLQPVLWYAIKKLSSLKPGSIFKQKNKDRIIKMCNTMKFNEVEDDAL